MSSFKILIDRKIKGDSCTQGYIFVNRTAIAYTLELPDLNNQNYISSIPKDVYKAFIRTDGPRGWRVELRDVPERTNVQIHVGNYTRQTEGCILIGEGVDIDGCTVTNSKNAIKTLRAKFDEYSAELETGDTVDIDVQITGI